MSRRRWVLAALAGAAIVLVAGRALASLYVEHVWFATLGIPSIGRAALAGEVLLRGGTTVLATLFLFANLYVVRRSVVSLVLPQRVGDIEFGEEVPGRYLLGAAALIAFVVGSFLGIAGDHWPQFAIALDDVRFGERDPYLERDLGFYVTRLPAELLLFAWAQRLMLVTAVVAFGLYALTPSIRWRARTLYVSEYVRRHLTVLGGLLLVLFAWAFRLESFALLVEGSGAGGAFSAVDLRVRVPGSLVVAATSLAAGLVVMGAGVAGQIRAAFLAVSVMLLLTVVLRYVLPVALAPAGDRVRAEQPFLETRDNFTRRAFGGDRVSLLRSDVDSAAHVAAAHGVALWDAPALRRALDGAAAIGWTRSGDGVYALVVQRGFIEDGESTPWTVTSVAAWTSDAAGGPMVVRPPGGTSSDVLPPVIDVDSAPRYRMLADPAGIVLGAPADHWGLRLAHAWALQNFRLLPGRLPEPAPVILFRPQLNERIAAAVPFFVQGEAVHPAVAGDTLFWIVDLYTASSTYPLSEPLTLAGAQRRYFHPAGHAIVNAATGLVRVAPVGDPEPPVRSWIGRFPELFVEAAMLPDGLRGALVPHAEAARARAIAFARYGPTALDAPAARRHLAVEHGADSVNADGLAPVALVGRPGLTLTVPLLDTRDRIAGIVIASGPDAATRWLPATGAPRYWANLLDALRVADSTPGRRDARYVRGRVRTVPLPESFAYVQPTYLWPTRGEPALASVNVVTESGVSSGWGLHAALGDTLSRLPGVARPLDPSALYARMREALRRGDWQAFGAAFDSLGRALAATAGKLPEPPALDSLRAPQP